MKTPKKEKSAYSTVAMAFYIVCPCKLLEKERSMLSVKDKPALTQHNHTQLYIVYQALSLANK